MDLRIWRRGIFGRAVQFAPNWIRPHRGSSGVWVRQSQVNSVVRRPPPRSSTDRNATPVTSPPKASIARAGQLGKVREPGSASQATSQPPGGVRPVAARATQFGQRDPGGANIPAGRTRHPHTARYMPSPRPRAADSSVTAWCWPSTPQLIQVTYGREASGFALIRITIVRPRRTWHEQSSRPSVSISVHKTPSVVSNEYLPHEAPESGAPCAK